MINNSLLITFFVFLLVFLFLVYSKCENLFYEKFSNIEVLNPKVEDSVFEKEDSKGKNDSKNKNIDNNITNVDYKNDSILLSCFKKNKLDTFNKYEKYSTKLYYKENNKTVGEVWITPSHIMKHLPQITLNGYFLNNLCVKKEHRRKGIARKLMEKVIEKAKREDKLHILLHVESTKNPHLVDFYSDLGFQTYITSVNSKGNNYKLMFLRL